MNYSYAVEKRDIARIDKLNRIVELTNYWDIIRELTSSIKTNHALKRWQALAEVRYNELRAMYIRRYKEKSAYVQSITNEAEMEQVKNFILNHGSLTGLSESIISNAVTLKMYYSQLIIFGLLDWAN